jgi:signal transduction histidine kinase
VSVSVGEAGLSLVLADNGKGFTGGNHSPSEPLSSKPWSLNERVHELGGDLRLYSTPNGTNIIISVPFGAQK